MSASTTADSLAQPDAKYETVIEVMDDTGAWVDLTDRIAHDRMMNMGGVSAQAERDTGSTSITANSLQFDNADGWWDRVDVTGLPTFYRRKMRIGVRTAGSTSVQYIGTWLVADVQTDEQGIAYVTVEGLAKRLGDKDADRVRDGESWYANRPIGWLVRELLAAEYTRAEVESWSPGIITRYAIPLSDPTAKALSAYGRPPEFDGTRWHSEHATPYGNATVAVRLPGTSKDVLFVGVENTVWYWDPAKDTWLRHATLPPGHTSKKIMHLFANPVAGHSVVVVIAWDPDVPGSTEDVAGDISGAKSGDVFMGWFLTNSAPSDGLIVSYVGVPSGIYTGHFFVRVGGHAGNVTGVGGAVGSAQLPWGSSGGAYSWGANMPLPAGEWLRTLRSLPQGAPQFFGYPTAWNNRTDAGDWLNGLGHFGSVLKTWIQSNKGYAGITYVDDATDRRPLNYRFTCGQRAGAFAHMNAGDFLVFTVIRYDAASHTYKLRFWKLDTWNDGCTDTGVDVNALSGLITSMRFRPDDSKLGVSGVTWNETNWGGSATTAPDNCLTGQITEYLWSSLATTPATLFTSVENTAFKCSGWLPMEFVYGTDPTRWMTAAFLNYKGVGTSEEWVVSTADLTYGGGSSYGRWEFTSQPSYSSGRCAGLIRVVEHGRIYWHEAGTNTLRSFPDDINSELAQVHDAGFPPVPGDTSLAHGLVYVASSDLLMGISGPGQGAQCDPQTMGTPMSGKYYLWQYANFLTDRIELADFTDMKIADALEALAAVGDFVQGFDESGNFKFMARPAPTTTVFTARRDAMLPGEFPLRTLRKLRGYDEVYNVAEVTPSVAILKQPTGNVNLLARDLGQPIPATGSETPAPMDPWNGSVEAVALTSRSGTVTLKVVEGGAVGSWDKGSIAIDINGKIIRDAPLTNTSTQVKTSLRMSFLRVSAMVESQLLVAALDTDTSVTLPLEHVQDVQPPPLTGATTQVPGDTIRIGDEREFTIIDRHDDDATATSVLQLDEAIGKAYDVGTKVAIRARGNNRWSDGPLGIAAFSRPPGDTSQTTTQADTANNNTVAYPTLSQVVVDDARDRVYVAWGEASTPGALHNSVIKFAAFNRTTGAEALLVTVEPATGHGDMESVSLALMSDGTLVLAYGKSGVRAKESTDGGATWDGGTTIDGTFGASTRALCGLIQSYDGSALAVITQETGGGGSLRNLYVRNRTGSAAWDTIALIHDAVGTGTQFVFGLGGTHIGCIGASGAAAIVGSYVPSGASLTQVAVLYTLDAWGTTAVTALATYGAGVDRKPTMVQDGVGRMHVAWVESGDLYLAYADTVDAWTPVGAPVYLAAVPWTVTDRMLVALPGGSLVVGAFDGTDSMNLIHHVWQGGDSLTGWNDEPVQHIVANPGTPTEGDAAVSGVDFWRAFANLDTGGAVHVRMLVARGVILSGVDNPSTASPGDLVKQYFDQTVDMSPGMVLRVTNASGTEDMRVAYLDPDEPESAAWVHRGIGGVTVPILDGDIARAFICPVRSTDYPEEFQWGLGASGVALIFRVPSSGEKPFMVGDTIDIVAPGLVLQSQDKATHVAQDIDSIAKFGKIPWRGIRQAKFLGYRQAEEVARRAVRDNAWPKFRFQCTAPLALLPTLNSAGLFVDRDRLQSQGGASPNGDNPPVAPDTVQGVAAVVRSYTVNPYNDTVNLEAKAVHSHVY